MSPDISGRVTPQVAQPPSASATTIVQVTGGYPGEFTTEFTDEFTHDEAQVYLTMQDLDIATAYTPPSLTAGARLNG